MQTTTLDFHHNARTTYTAVKRLFDKSTKFSSVKCNDDLFIVEARHGLWLSPFSENVKMKIVATSSQTCKVVVESSSRSILNLLNFGANKGNGSIDITQIDAAVKEYLETKRSSRILLRPLS
jgi:hypothetical protein